uniref:Pyruvate kinase C-terminal domain-containing protein n=1 Tax=Ditylum brightwellii TaxID=49249 RepID=A0A6V2BMK6_9STRA
MQQRIINRVEADSHYRKMLHTFEQLEDTSPSNAIVLAARQIARSVQAKSIVSFTLRGSTVLRASQGRPSVPILAISPFKETARQLALSWGVYPGKSQIVFCGVLLS